MIFPCSTCLLPIGCMRRDDSFTSISQFFNCCAAESQTDEEGASKQANQIQVKLWSRESYLHLMTLWRKSKLFSTLHEESGELVLQREGDTNMVCSFEKYANKCWEYHTTFLHETTALKDGP